MDLTTVHQGIHKRKKRKRIGRGPGSKRGRTATMGNKGQYARSGDNPAMLKEGGQMQLFRRVAKRGFNNKWKTIFAVVNVGDIQAVIDVLDGFDGKITPEFLKACGLAKHPHDQVKILGNGDLTAKLEVVAHAFSQSARQKIEAVGGQCLPAPMPHRGPKIRNKMRPKKQAAPK